MSKNHVKVKEGLVSKVLANAQVATLSKQELMRLYGVMLHARRFEETCAVLYTQKLIAGFCHLYSGQEAIAVGIQSILEQDDNVITAYRCHCHALIARMYSQQGWKPKSKDGQAEEEAIFDQVQEHIDEHSEAKATMAELMGRQTGSSKGKGGSMHLYDREHNFFGGHGIVGIQIPLGVGLAFADKYHDKKHVTFASLGDGAMNQGQVYEAMNMAALWKLPVVFVLENNGYAIGTAVNRASAGTNFWKRAAAFDMPAYEIDGMNVLEVVEHAKKAKQHALEKGPVFLEMNTYRYRPHSMSDPATYRTREEVNNVKETRDPITFLRNILSKQHGVTEEMFARFDEKEAERIKEVKTYAEESPFPGPEELESDIWASPL